MYFILKTLELLFKNIPRKAGYFLFETIAMIFYTLGGKRKRTLKTNLTNVLNGKNPEKTLLKEVYKNYARYYFDLFTDNKKLLEATDCSAWPNDEIMSAWKKYGSLIVVTPHFGNWDHGGNFIASLYPEKISVVVEELSPPAYKWFTEIRSKWGMNLIRSTDLKGIIKAIKSGHLLVLAADRDLDKTGYKIDMFGKKAHIPSGPAKLSTMMNIPICFAYMMRNPEDKMRFIPCIDIKMINLDKKKRTDENNEIITKELLKKFERLFAKHPEQWCMLQQIFL